MLPKTATPRIVVLKADLLYGDMLCRQIKEYWRGAQVQVFQKGFDALDAIQASTPDMFITGVKIEDMDGLEHLEPFIERDLPILIVTTRKDARTLCLLREIRYNGLFDVRAEAYANLHTAMQRVLEGEIYVSPTFAPHVKRPKNNTLDALTEKEEMVLSVIGDGSDDQQTADRLGLSPHTVNTHRKSIMGKLGLHHKGQIMCYAVQNGYVEISPQGVFHPGFQRKIRKLAADKNGTVKTCV
ncbi:MAG: response regulator transcription factor [Opitutaceae bacterium]|nr:response regulator transcription factor [Opitutaceae bacterium]